MYKRVILIIIVLAFCSCGMAGLAQDEPQKEPETSPAPSKFTTESARLWAEALNMFSSDGYISIESVVFHKLEFTDVKCKFEQKDGKFLFNNITANIGDGRVAGNILIDFNYQPVYFEVDLKIKDVRLEKLADRFKFVKEKSKGTLSGEFVIKGFGNKFETYEGTGEGDISGMEFGDIPIIFNFIDVFNLLDFRKDSFHSASFSFIIKDEKFEATKLNFLSNRISMENTKGHIGFDGTLDLYFSIQSRKQLFDQVPVIGTVINSVISKMGKFFSAVRVTGPIGRPDFKIVPFSSIFSFDKKKDKEKKSEDKHK